AVKPTGMSAVLGGDQDEVIQYLENMDITPANVNGGGQVVAAGSKDALAKLAEDPLDKTRVIELKVAGAFHTKYMAPAVADLQAFTETLAGLPQPVPYIWYEDRKMTRLNSSHVSSSFAVFFLKKKMDIMGAVI